MPSLFTLTQPRSESVTTEDGRAWLARVLSLDVIVVSYITATVLLVLWGQHLIPHAGRIVWIHLGGLGLYLFARWASLFGPAWRILLYISFFVVVVGLFEGIGSILPHIRADVVASRAPDRWLAEVDLRLFGSEPTTWFTPVLTPLSVTVLQIGYTTYYFLAIVTGIVLIAKRKLRSILSYAAVLIGCLFTSYLGYYLVPAYGPRLFYEYATPIPHSVLSQEIYDLIDRLDMVMLNAFPSGHTALSLVTLSVLFYEARRVAWLFVPLVAGLIVATVALRYHYVIDVVAGIVVWALWVPWGMRLVFRFDNRPSRPPASAPEA